MSEIEEGKKMGRRKFLTAVGKVAAGAAVEALLSGCKPLPVEKKKQAVLERNRAGAEAATAWVESDKQEKTRAAEKNATREAQMRARGEVQKQKTITMEATRQALLVDVNLHLKDLNSLLIKEVFFPEEDEVIVYRVAAEEGLNSREYPSICSRKIKEKALNLGDVKSYDAVFKGEGGLWGMRTTEDGKRIFNCLGRLNNEGEWEQYVERIEGTK